MRQTSKVPILGSIPILGWLFGGEKEINKNTEVVVAIDPVTIMDYAVARLGPDEERVISQAAGDEPIEQPVLPYGMDMHVLDPHRNVSVDPVR